LGLVIGLAWQNTRISEEKQEILNNIRSLREKIMFKRISIYYKLLLGTALTAIIPLVILGYILTTINIDSLYRLVKEYYLSITDNIVQVMRNEIDSLTQDLKEFSSILSDDRLRYEDKINLIAVKIARSSLIDYILIYDENGKFLDMLKPKDTPFPFEIRENLEKEVIESLLHTDRYISEIIYPGENTYPFIRIVVKWDYKGNLLGYLETYYSLEHLSDVVSSISKRRFGGSEDLVFLVANDGSIVAHNNRDYVLSRYNLLRKGIFGNIDSVERLKEIFAKDLGFSTEYLEDGTEFVGNFGSLPDLNLGVVVYQKKSEAFASVKRMIFQILLWNILVIILVLLTSFIVSKNLTKPIFKLTDAIRKISKEKKLGLQVDVKSSDEIGEMASAFNIMSSELLRYSEQLKEASIIQANLSRYFSPSVVEQIMKSKEILSLGGVKKNIAVMFADVRNFTSICELSDPEIVSHLLNILFTNATKIIFKWGGTVDKFIGDCIMAIFNAPYDLDDYIYRCVMAGKEIINFVKAERENFKRSFGYDISVGIGINAGEAIVGNLGSSDIMEYTAIGDTVNTAARIESISGENQLLISEICYNEIKDRIDCEFLSEMELKGKREKVKIYSVKIE